jgi:hypothetical protein
MLDNEMLSVKNGVEPTASECGLVQMPLLAVAASWLLFIPTTLATLITRYWLVSIQVTHRRPRRGF